MDIGGVKVAVKNVWTKEKEQYVIEHYGVKSVTEIAEYLGMKNTVVSAKAYTLRKKGLNVREVPVKYTKWTEEQTEYLKENYGKESVINIAKGLGVETYVIYNKIRKLEGKGVPGFKTNRKRRYKGTPKANEGKEIKLNNIRNNIDLGKKYTVKQNTKVTKKNYFEGVAIHQNSRHITLQNTKTKVRETFLRVDLLISEYSFKEVM